MWRELPSGHPTMLMLRPLAHYADFRGRSHRGEYVLFVAAQTLFFGILAILVYKAVSSSGMSLSGAVPILLGVASLTWAGLLIPNLSLQARRLHDTNRSARWMGLMVPGILAPVILVGSAIELLNQVTKGGLTEGVMMAQLGSAGAASLVWLLGTVGNMVLVGMLLLPGSSGPNRFGADPKDEAIRSGQGSNVFDDDKLEVLFAEARRKAETPDPASGHASARHPGASQQGQTSTRTDWPAHGQGYGEPSVRGFGRRGG